MRGRFYFAAMALAALAVPAASAASASADRSVSAGSKSSSLCPGGTLLTAVSARRLPGGAMAYKYVLRDGTSFENIAPPAGFNVGTASNALLKELNFPPRPAGAAARKTWRAQVAPFGKSRISRSSKFCQAAVPHSETGIINQARAAAGRHAGGVTPRGSVGHTGSSIWSGYELRSGHYQRAVGHFTQPFTDSGGARAFSSWVGLNSSSNGRLVQAGAGDGSGAPGGSPFWELFCSPNPGDCNSAQVSSTIGSNPGDVISVNVSVDSNNVSYYQVAINGSLVINTSKQMRSDASTGGVADFITERTAGDVIPTFTLIQFSAARTYANFNSSTSVPFGSQNFYAYELTNDGKFYSAPCSTSTHILMYPSNVVSDGFQNNFCRGA